MCWSKMSYLKLNIGFNLGPAVALVAVGSDAVAVEHVTVPGHRPHVHPFSVAVSLKDLASLEMNLGHLIARWGL